MGTTASSVRAAERTLALLEAVLDGDTSSIAAAARRVGVPVSTAHRQVATLVAEHYLTAAGRNGHVAGPRLFALLSRLDPKDALTRVALPELQRLATELGTVVQLGTLEQDMVTYRAKAGNAASGLFTEVGSQLEAYCTALGKVLLAHLPPADQSSYLASGAFVALTSRTITDPQRLATELAHARSHDYAVDDAETADDLYCVAVPIRTPDGKVVAALSASSHDRETTKRLLPRLRDGASRIAATTFGDHGSW